MMEHRTDAQSTLRAYANGRAVLADHLHVEPEPETMALAKHICHTASVLRNETER